MSLSVLILFLTVVAASRRHPELPESPIALSGKNVAQINPAEYTADYWINKAQAAIQSRSQRDPDQNVAKNLVMFLGDGMSLPTVAAARNLKGQKAGNTGDGAQLYFETFPGIGLVKTYSVDYLIPDSACTATAYLCGVKNNFGTLGVTAAVNRGNCKASLNKVNRVQSIAEWALAGGKDVGIVTTARVTDASPAGTYAKSADRLWENDAQVILKFQDPRKCIDIARQLIKMSPGNRFKVILGGGRREFIPKTMNDEEGTKGNRMDGRNLIEEWKQDKIERNLSHAYVWNREQLRSQLNDPPEYLLGLFESGHLKYNLEKNETTEPTLEELTDTAIRMLSRNENGFFLFVEGGRIDHAHHDNYVQLALDEALEFDKAIEKAGKELSEKDSLIVVTSDHAHVMAFNGYTVRGGDILGLSVQTDRHNVPYMILSYTNGPGARAKRSDGVRKDIRQEKNFGKLRWPSHAEMPLATETHGGDDVAVFARGPHYRMFSALYEQNEIPHLMAYAGCIGPGLHADGCKSAISVPRTALLVENRNSAVSLPTTVLLIIFTTVFRFFAVR